MEQKSDKPRVLMMASVASMIDLFNSENIRILIDLGCRIDVAANFQEGSITSKERVADYYKELISQGIEVIDIPIPRSIARLKQIFKSYKVVKKLADTRRYKFVHCHSPIGGVITRLAFIKARKAGTKVIYTGHGLHFFKGASLKNWLLFYPIERICAFLTDVIIAINQEDYMREKTWGCCEVRYVPGIGVDTKAFQKGISNRCERRKEFGLLDDDFVFMSTGQISIRKNHEVVIRALAQVNNEKVKYLIVGFGELEKKLKQLTDDLGLTERVIFAGYRGDVRDLLHIVDAFIFPSLQEGLPVALMEAMSVGLPVVCSKIRGNVDLIKDGEGGYLYDSKDINGFAEGITKISEGNCIGMGLINRETMKKFDKAEVNSCMIDIYKKQLDSE